MTQSQISVARVLELDVPLSWQECVAIAGEVTILRAIGPSIGQRQVRIDTESCFLSQAGEVLLPIPAYSDVPLADLQLLRALLAGRDIPIELEQLAYGPPPQHLGDALAMFSRPDRRADIAAVALRGLAADVQLRTSSPPAPSPEEFAAESEPAAVKDDISALRAHVGQRSVPPHAPLPSAPARQNWRSTNIAAAFGAVVAVVAIAGGYWAIRRPPLPPTPEQSMPDDLVPAERDDSWEVAGHRTEDVELGHTATPRAAPPRRADVPPPLLLGRAAAGGRDETNTAPASPVPPGEPSATLPPDGPEPTAASLSADAPVYSWRAAGIDPPVMVFPRMPKAAFPPPEVVVKGQYIEVLVGQSGTVEAVRLRGSPLPGTPAYHYAMILAAAKAWQFTPARRNGEPVRYVARVVLEQ